MFWVNVPKNQLITARDSALEIYLDYCQHHQRDTKQMPLRWRTDEEKRRVRESLPPLNRRQFSRNIRRCLEREECRMEQ